MILADVKSTEITMIKRNLKNQDEQQVKSNTTALQ